MGFHENENEGAPAREKAARITPNATYFILAVGRYERRLSCPLHLERRITRCPIHIKVLSIQRPRRTSDKGI